MKLGSTGPSTVFDAVCACGRRENSTMHGKIELISKSFRLMSRFLHTLKSSHGNASVTRSRIINEYYCFGCSKYSITEP